MLHCGRGLEMAMSLHDAAPDGERSRALVRAANWMELAALAEPLGFWWTDLESDRSWVSGGIATILGRDPEGQLRRSDVLDAIHPEDRERVLGARAEFPASGSPFAEEFRIVCPNGDVRLVRATALALRSHGINELIGVLADVTARRQLDLELAGQRAQLAHFNRLGVVGQLSGAVVHEVAQPLTSILMNARTGMQFLDANTRDLDGELRSILDDIAGAAARTATIVQRVRTLMRRDLPSVEPIDLGHLIGEVVAMVHSELLLREIRLEQLIARDHAVVTGDAVQLQQVLINLIINACDAVQTRPPGSRRITIEARADASGNGRISIADTGTGIAVTPTGRVFEPFVSSKAGGVGLGLAICRQIVVAHRGRIWAENLAAGGAVFHLLLPSSTASTALAAAQRRAQVIARGHAAAESARVTCDAVRQSHVQANEVIERARELRRRFG